VIIELLLGARQLAGRLAVAAQLVEKRDIDLLAVRLEVDDALNDAVVARARIGVEPGLAQKGPDRLLAEPDKLFIDVVDGDGHLFFPSFVDALDKTVLSRDLGPGEVAFRSAA